MIVGEDVVQNSRETDQTSTSGNAIRFKSRIPALREARHTTREVEEEEISSFMATTLRPSASTSSFPSYTRPLRIWTQPLNLLTFALVILLSLAQTANTAFINFDNCLDANILNSAPPTPLQFVPLFLNARYTDSNSNRYNLNITIYGNVTGQATVGNYPPTGSSDWNDPDKTFGKIVNFTANYTTLSSTAKVLTYTPWAASPSIFCDSTVNTSCPIGPSFFKNASDPYDLSAFTVAHDFSSSYAFATFGTTVRVVSGDRGAPNLACVSANITPDLGTSLSNAFRYVPLAVLVLVGVATLLAARFSPWSSPDPFYWSSNFGRDPDLLRLITPGFGDCLQYIQFVVLAGSLSLNYPGFYQPVVSKASWSTLMFNESFVTGGDGTESLRDGIYFSNGTYGLSRMSQLVGMTDDEDVWADMAIWLCVIIGAVVLLTQLYFAVRFLQQRMKNDRGSDLRQKNLPFTAGMIVRICFNWFNLPIFSLSLFQLVIGPTSPASVVAMSVVLLVAMLGSAGWIFRLIFATKPRVQLFDDLPTLLTYGPLYNTYSDEAAPFAFIPVLLTFIRGAAIGAVQPSGIAQLVLLAICEVIFILTLHAFRPFNAPTSMNAYHTSFAVIRLVTTLLSIAFVPTLGVSEAAKGWIGYAILLLHAIVLVFGFFLNALQTLIEVAGRASGAGNREARGGLTKVFGMRQLSKRARRRNVASSLQSDAAILTQDVDAKSIQLRDGGRSRSLSASSAVLLQGQMSHHRDRTSTGLESGDFTSYQESAGPSTPGATSPFSTLQSGAPAAGRRATSKSLEQNDPYYRPPRPRRPTLEPVLTDDPKTPERNTIAEPYRDSPERAEHETAEGTSSWYSPFGRNSITPAFLRSSHAFSDNMSEAGGQPRPPTDYAVRESDFYYGVRRGPALSSVPSRRLRTGPADPVGPVSSASGWFKNLFGGAKKEKGKGFEVVRSRPVPLGVLDEDEPDTSPPLAQEPYRDSPPGVDSERDSPQERSRDIGDQSVMEPPQLLGPIETGGDISMPSRYGSRASRDISGMPIAGMPAVPRRSSKRTPSMDAAILFPPSAGHSIQSSRQQSPARPEPGPTRSEVYLHPGAATQARSSTTRLPFGAADFAPDSHSSNEPSPSPDRGNTRETSPDFRTSTGSSIYPTSEGGTPILGGEGAGFDDPVSRAATMRTMRSSAADARAAAEPRPDLPIADVVAGRNRGLSATSGRDFGDSRPVSTGRVGRHLASESVRNAAAELGGLGATEAEFVGGEEGWGRGRPRSKGGELR